MTEIEILRMELNKINSYPSELEKVDCRIKGKGFFPGARGLSNDHDQTISNKPIMILGQDFGTKRDYENSVIRGHENQRALTWNNLNKMLLHFEINEDNCFFTNCIMGVRAAGQSAVGKSIAYNYPEYLEDCRELFIKQISIQRPKLIISLGLSTLELLGSMSEPLNAIAKIRSFIKLDINKKSVFENIEFFCVPNFKTNLVIITHPTYWHLNVKHRKFNEFSGMNAEKEIVGILN